MKFKFSLLALIFSFSLNAQEIITNGQLSITINETESGVELISIKDSGSELLNLDAAVSHELFNLSIQNTINNADEILTSATNWENISIDNNNGNCTITLSNPSVSKPNLPSTLAAIITIRTNGSKSEWDLDIAGLGNCSLMDAVFPMINIEANGNDVFFIPKYHGQLIHNPATSINYNGLYPRGWGATMQYLAYYNNDHGVYFGFHDPKANTKKMLVNNESNGVSILCAIPVPDKTIAGNDWNFPGKFKLDLFEGDWYDASLIYKQWAMTSADYWPKDTPRRLASQQSIGNIGMWFTNELSDFSGNTNRAQALYSELADFLEIPFGLHLYNWNSKLYDDDYPNYFPETDGFAQIVKDLQNSKDIHIMPYINGRLFDTDLEGYDDDGYPYAVKINDSIIESQDFYNNHFAVMCPSQKPWQDTIVDACVQITERIGAAAIYIDQVCAASPLQCMDTTHNHPLGAGSLWRDGYHEMFDKIAAEMPEGKFITSESGCDYLADNVDGFMIAGWTTNNMVPAFSTIYTGKVHLFGVKTGTGSYGKQKFYGKLAQAFTFGSQPGRQSLWLGLNLANASDDKLMALDYVKSLGQMRYKLRDFMSFGQMYKPLNLSNVPTLSFEINDFGTVVQSNIQTIQNGVWKNKEGNKILFLFANASMTDDQNFVFDVNLSDYGLDGELTIQEVTPTDDGTIENVNNLFSRSVSLNARNVVGYIVSGTPTEIVETPNITQIGVYPNPAKNYLTIDGKGLISSIQIVNMEGVVLKYEELEANSNTISLDNIPNGLYLIQVNSNLGIDWYKFVVDK